MFVMGDKCITLNEMNALVRFGGNLTFELFRKSDIAHLKYREMQTCARDLGGETKEEEEKNAKNLIA